MPLILFLHIRKLYKKETVFRNYSFLWCDNTCRNIHNRTLAVSLCSFCFRLSFIGCKSQYHSQPLAWTFFTNHFFTGYEDKLLWTLMLLGKIKRLVIYYSSTCSGGNSKNESPYDNLWDLLHEPRSTNLILCLLVTCKRFIQGSKA